MKILILSSSAPYRTAGIISYDLYKLLSSTKENKVVLAVKGYEKHKEENIISIDNNFNYVIRKFSNIVRCFFNIITKKRINLNHKTDSKYSVQNYNQQKEYYSTKRILKKINFRPNIIIIQFIQNFLTYKNLYELNSTTNATILIHLPDMAPLTGGCHYAWNCTNYIENCGKCPALFSSVDNDQSRKNWFYKNKYIKQTNIIAIAGSEWQYKQLKKSSLFSNKIKTKILAAINDKLFCPGQFSKVRKELGVPIGKKIIFFGAVSVNNQRKGFPNLMESLEILKKIYEYENIHIVIAGKIKKDILIKLPFEFTVLGYLNHEYLAKAFQSADLFVCPSIEDSGPMMINQSILCGTPVVAFDMGVALDLVISEVTGYRVELGNAEKLARGMHKILSLEDDEYIKMRNNCRKIGLKLTGFDSIKSQWMMLLNKIMKEKLTNEN